MFSTIATTEERNSRGIPGGSASKHTIAVYSISVEFSEFSEHDQKDLAEL